MLQVTRYKLQVSDFDVIVIGGGPAGSVAAGFLAQTGARVLLFEKERFPRYHIGESLLSASLPIFDALGVMPEIERAGFVRKPGGTFVWGRNTDPWSFFFREDPGGRPHAFHVVRSQFDEILLRHAAHLGVEVREGCRVHSVAYEGSNSVTAIDDRGVTVTASATYIIDASGQQAVLGNRDRLREFNPFFKNLAVFGYFAEAEPLAGELNGNILSAAFADGWFWFIPLHDGTTSVGAVIDAQRFAGEASCETAGADMAGAEALYFRLISRCRPIAERLCRARLSSPVRVIRDYSYCSRHFYGPGYLLAGDAACFIDPVFSTGVHLASLAGFLASRAVEAILGGALELQEQQHYDACYRAAFQRYLNFLYFFYDHHRDPASYFWTARKILAPGSNLDQRVAFVRLMSGGGDLIDGDVPLRDQLDAQHLRLERATHAGRFGATPESGLFRVRGTVQQMHGTRRRADE